MPDTTPAHRTTITESERLQLLGLVTIARQHQRQADATTRAAEQLLGGPADRFGLDDLGLYDVVAGEREVDWLLERNGITVEATNDAELDRIERDELATECARLRDAVRSIHAASDTSEGAPESPINRLAGIHDETRIVLGIADHDED